MADILAALEGLEQQEKKKKAANKTPAEALAEATRANSRRPSRGPPIRPLSRPPPSSQSKSLPPSQQRTRSVPPAPRSPLQHRLSPTSPSAYAASARQGDSNSAYAASSDSRRISFADPPRVNTRFQVKIATKTDSLSSQFPYDAQKLIKYEISSKEWNMFTNEIVVAADAHHYNAITWTLHRKKVIQDVKKDLQYGGDVKKVLKKWNYVFKRQGFQAWLELPSEEAEEETGRMTAGMNKADQRKAQKETKRFRVVVSPLTDKGTSIYSHASSLRGSISGEGSAALKTRVPPPPELTESEVEGTAENEKKLEIIIKVDEGEKKDENTHEKLDIGQKDEAGNTPGPEAEKNDEIATRTEEDLDQNGGDKETVEANLKR